MGGTLVSTTNPSQSGLGSNDKQKVLQTLVISRTVALLSDAV